MTLLAIVAIFGGVLVVLTLILGVYMDRADARLYRAAGLTRAPMRVPSVRANPPQPEPVEDPWSLHDHVLKYFLSPELRGEFANSPNFTNNTLSSSEPAGSLSKTTLQGVVSTNELRTGLQGPVSTSG